MRLATGTAAAGPRYWLRTATSLFCLARNARRQGAGWRAIGSFVRTRYLRSQLRVVSVRNLALLPSVPYTFGQYPWVIEVEDTTSLFFPFVHNGRTRDWSVHESPIYPVIRALIQSASCRGILTHVRSTAESLPKIFRDEALREKVFFQPLGVDLQGFPAVKRSAVSAPRLLFTHSWHQSPESFYLRGGLDLLRAVEHLRERGVRVRLTLRSPLPVDLAENFREIVSDRDVKVIDRFLPADAYRALLRDSDIYVLPAARIHVMSLLEAMASSLAVVVSDGWGVEEYVAHESTGLVVRGRHGKVSWADPVTGVLREDYSRMREVDEGVARGVADAVERLAFDGALRLRLGESARRAVETRYNLERWNSGLAHTLDAALGRRRRGASDEIEPRSPVARVALE